MRVQRYNFSPILQIDIDIFSRFLVDDYSMDDPDSYQISVPKKIDRLKDLVLNRMIKQYNIIGEDTIRFIIGTLTFILIFIFKSSLSTAGLIAGVGILLKEEVPGVIDVRLASEKPRQ